MAGAGFKTFTTGEVLLAADVNTYLMQQTVMVFDDATARSTAIAAPSEGMMSYLKDTNLTYRYDGSNWVSDAGATSPLTTKGDIWVYGTSDTRLPVGTNGYTLVADSTESLGVKWQAPASGGGYTLINTGGTTLTGSSVTVSSIPGTYRDLYVLAVNYDPANDDEQLRFYVNSDNGTKYGNNFASTGALTFNTTSARLVYAQDNGTSNALGYTFIRAYTENTWKIFDGVSITNDKTTPTSYVLSTLYGVTNITAAITSITFINDTGNFSGGTVYVYGVN